MFMATADATSAGVGKKLADEDIGETQISLGVNTAPAIGAGTFGGFGQAQLSRVYSFE